MSSCSCAKKDNEAKDLKTYLNVNKEKGFGCVLPDSISDIIISADRISCRLEAKSPEDTLRVDECVVEIPNTLQPIVKFMFLNEQNFQSDNIVYGKFNPWAVYIFQKNKKEQVTLELDFGLSKWRLLDNGQQQIFGGDMKELNMQFLSITRMLFPDDITLNLLNDNLKFLKK